MKKEELSITMCLDMPTKVCCTLFCIESGLFLVGRIRNLYSRECLAGELKKELGYSMLSQFVTTLPNRRNKSNPPYAFTEHGAVMLAAVLRSPSAVQMSVMVTRAFIAMRQAITTMLSMDLKVEQISHKVDQLNAYVEEILHDQNDINAQQEQTNNEIAIQIEAINGALDELRNTQPQARIPIGFKSRD